jgi:hypothetical protein
MHAAFPDAVSRLILHPWVLGGQMTIGSADIISKDIMHLSPQVVSLPSYLPDLVTPLTCQGHTTRTTHFVVRCGNGERLPLPIILFILIRGTYGFFFFTIETVLRRKLANLLYLIFV